MQNDEHIEHTEWCAPATSNETENEIGGRDAGSLFKPKKTEAAQAKYPGFPVPSTSVLGGAKKKSKKMNFVMYKPDRSGRLIPVS